MSRTRLSRSAAPRLHAPWWVASALVHAGLLVLLLAWPDPRERTPAELPPPAFDIVLDGGNPDAAPPVAADGNDAPPAPPGAPVMPPPPLAPPPVAMPLPAPAPTPAPPTAAELPLPDPMPPPPVAEAPPPPEPEPAAPVGEAPLPPPNPFAGAQFLPPGVALPSLPGRPGGTGLAPTGPRLSETPPTADPSLQVRGARVGADWRAAFRAWLDQRMIYPPEAAQRGESGSVRVQIRAAADGTVLSVRLMMPSVSPSLNSNTLRPFRDARLPPFPPPVDPEGVTIDLTVNYILRP